MFNVCTGRSTSVVDLAAALAELNGTTAAVRHGKARVGDIRKSVGDPAAAIAALGVRALIDLPTGLRATLRGMADTQDSKPGNPRRLGAVRQRRERYPGRGGRKAMHLPCHRQASDLRRQGRGLPVSSYAELSVDLGAVADNWRGLRARHGGAVAGVVKADAYGLGAAAVAPALHRAGCRHFFVAHLDEALAIRDRFPAPCSAC